MGIIMKAVWRYFLNLFFTVISVAVAIVKQDPPERERLKI
jgi:hypothetical protein